MLLAVEYPVEQRETDGPAPVHQCARRIESLASHSGLVPLPALSEVTTLTATGWKEANHSLRPKVFVQGLSRTPGHVYVAVGIHPRTVSRRAVLPAGQYIAAAIEHADLWWEALTATVTLIDVKRSVRVLRYLRALSYLSTS